MRYLTTELMSKISRTDAIVDGLNKEQELQMRELLVRATDLEFSAIYSKRCSCALGASIEGF